MLTEKKGKFVVWFVYLICSENQYFALKMPQDSYVAAEILATCNALGSEIHGRYLKSSDCLNCLKDLLRYLKRDDNEHSVLRQLGELNLLQTDLLPILEHYNGNREIFDMTLRLLVILTHPAFLLYNEVLPDDKFVLNTYLSIITILQKYKQAFTDSNVWSVLFEALKQCLSQSYEDRDEDDRLVVERILVIMRNVLHTPPDDISECRTDDDVNVHDQVLWAMHLSGIIDLILYLSRTEEENAYCLHVLEIVSLMLREQTPKILATSGQHRTTDEKFEDERKLVSVRKKEMKEKLERERKLASRRFHGVYYVKNMKSISERDHITHKLLSKEDTFKFDSADMTKRIAKNRLPLKDVDLSRRSTLSIRVFLKDFCNEFVKNSYNTFMLTVRRSLSHSRSENHDDSYYLWAMHYFMEFNRLTGFEVSVVSETLSIETFHYIQTQVDSYYERLLADKKEVKLWSFRMHLGLKAYKELLETLKVMSLATEDEQHRKCADIILSNVFYTVEYREMLLGLLQSYDEMKFSMAYLVDIIETNHLFLKMLDNHTKKHSNLIVQTKQRRKSTKRKKKATVPSSASAVPTLHEQWDSIADELSDALQGKFPLPSDSTPFDATSDLSFEEQRVEVVFKIHNAMIAKNAGQSVSLLRAARELWPEDDAFGYTEIPPEEEFMVLQEIFMTELPQRQQQAPPPMVEIDNPIEVEQVEDEEEEAEPAIAPINVVEQHLNSKQFFDQFSSPKVVKHCCHLLDNFQNNSASTNNALLKLMHRIAWGSKMFGLFFQASLFLTFQKILKESDSTNDPQHKELARFAKFILGKFFELAAKNNKMFMEMLFWKNVNNVHEMEEGYKSTASLAVRGRSAAWAHEEEQQLKEAYEKFKDSPEAQDDIIGAMIVSLGSYRSRKVIIAKLKNLGCITQAQELRSLQQSRSTKAASASKSTSADWQEMEIMDLTGVFEMHQYSDNPIQDIWDALTIKRSKKAVINKLLELNLISNPAQVEKGKRFHIA